MPQPTQVWACSPCSTMWIGRVTECRVIVGMSSVCTLIEDWVDHLRVSVQQGVIKTSMVYSTTMDYWMLSFCVGCTICSLVVVVDKFHSFLVTSPSSSTLLVCSETTPGGNTTQWCNQRDLYTNSIRITTSNRNVYTCVCCSTTRWLYLYPWFWQLNSHCQFLSHKHVRVVWLLEHHLKLFQLKLWESCSAALHLPCNSELIGSQYTIFLRTWRIGYICKIN